MSKHVLFVCKSCNFSPDQEKHQGQSGGTLLLNHLLESHQTWPGKAELEIQSVGCLCTCERPCVIALSGINKPTYLFTDLPPLESATDLLKLGRLYLDSEDGYVPNYKLPEVLQPKRLTRIPPWPQG